MNFALDEFFDPIQQTKYIGSENYRKIKYYLKTLQALSKVCNLSFYIVDYYKRSFQYVSPNPLFLNGYSQKEVMSLGFDFYPLCVPEDDLKLLLLLNEVGFDFFYQLSEDRRDKATISYDFRLKHRNNNSHILINHKLSPLLLTDEGNIWMSICLVTLSVMKKPGDVHIIMQDDSSRYDLNIRKRIFEKVAKQKLSPKEIEILKLLSLGYRLNDVANKLGISSSTVKNHKTRIFKKLNVKTTAEAVFLFANSQGIL
ncbi:response regulator transcription factor [Maribellus mangrovi]|uniref:response regulator transcription factor n=1 Tax=Maribellus mangrovi TaxID=3133146 RepID=UPI0030ED827C